jgi:hypothetical protein
MLKVLAIAAEDGWAFVRTDDDIRVVRPPYWHSNTSSTSEYSVQAAIARHGFSPCDEQFADWEGLTAFLNEKVRASRLARGEEIRRRGLGAEILQFAPANVLESFLSRVETELLPPGDWDSAERLLHDMLKVPEVRKNDSLFSRVCDLLVRVADGRRNSNVVREEIAQGQNGILASCPGLQERYTDTEFGQFNDQVTRRGQVLPVGE